MTVWMALQLCMQLSEVYQMYSRHVKFPSYNDASCVYSTLERVTLRTATPAEFRGMGQSTFLHAHHNSQWKSMMWAQIIVHKLMKNKNSKQVQQTTTSKHFIKRDTPAIGFGKFTCTFTGTRNADAGNCGTTRYHRNRTELKVDRK